MSWTPTWSRSSLLSSAPLGSGAQCSSSLIAGRKPMLSRQSLLHPRAERSGVRPTPSELSSTSWSRRAPKRATTASRFGDAASKSALFATGCGVNSERP